MSIADFTKYIVEDLFINNGETHFLDHHETKFVNVLLGSGGHRGVSSRSDAVFHYGGVTMMHNKSGEAKDGKQAGGASNKSPYSIIHFSLMEETEGFAMDISPCINANEMLRKLLSAADAKKLDLVLKARVMMYRPTVVQSEKVVLATTKRKNVDVSEHVQDERKKMARDAKEEVIPAGISKHTNGIPPALSKAWENQKVLAPTTLANDKSEAADSSESEMEVELPAAASATKNDAECDDDHDVTMNDVDSCVKETKKGNGKNASTQVLVASSTKKDSEENEPADASTSTSGGSDKNSEEEASETKSSDSILKVKSNRNLEEGSNSSASSDEDKTGADEGKSDNEEGVVDAGGSKVTKPEPKKKAESSIVSSSGGATSNTSDDKDDKIKKGTTQKKQVENEDSSSSESEDDGSSSSDSSSSSSEDSDDEEKSPVTQKSSSVAVVAPTEEPSRKKTDTAVTSSTQQTTKKDKEEVDKPPTPLGSGNAKTPYNVSAACSDPIFTQESAVDPRVLFEEMCNYKNDAATKHKRGGEIEASTTPFRADNESDDSSASISSSSDDEESDDEGDEEKSSEKKETAFKIEQNAKDSEKPQLYPLTQRIKSDSTSGSSSSSSEDEEEEKKAEPTATTTPKTNDRDGSSSSSSSSSDGSSSSSSSDSSSSDSDSSSSSSSSSDEEEDAKQVQKKTPAGKSLMPVVRSSRGRRRTPLVAMSRKIIINTSTTKGGR